MPDFFKGDPVPLKLADILIPVDAKHQSKLGKYTGLLASAPSFIMWLGRHKPGPTNKTCMDFLQALRLATPLTQNIGIVGFCWGGKYALRAGLESSMIEKEGQKVPLVNAVVAMHPSNLSLPEDVGKLVVPATIGWGFEDDEVKFETKAKIEELHAKAKIAGWQLPEVAHKVYTPGRHGFAVRGNPDDTQEKACLEESHAQALEWMDKYL
jgi:dienelactone hydrolase